MAVDEERQTLPTAPQVLGRDVVALVPAAGRGTRLPGRPCSKELLPVAYTDGDGTGGVRVVSQYLFDRLAAAGVARGVVVLREGKWDIPAFYGAGGPAGLDLAYVVVGHTAGPPASLAHAHPFVRDAVVAFGFPDLRFGPDDVYQRLLSRLAHGDVEVVLGLYPVQERTQSDVVGLDGDRVVSMFLKDPARGEPWCWACAVWTPRFSEFLRDEALPSGGEVPVGPGFSAVDASGDMPMGWIFLRALQMGLPMAGVVFSEQAWVDLGSFGQLSREAFTGR